MMLLWMVFAVLDRVIADHLTVMWAVVNVTIGVTGWAGAVYLELRSIRE